MPTSHQEYDHLFDRMLTIDSQKRAKMGEVVEILKEIKAKLPQTAVVGDLAV